MGQKILKNRLSEIMGDDVKPGAIIKELKKHGFKVTYQTLTNWRNNTTQPNLLEAYIIANFFEIIVNKLVIIEEVKNKWEPKNKHYSE